MSSYTPHKNRILSSHKIWCNIINNEECENYKISVLPEQFSKQIFPDDECMYKISKNTKYFILFIIQLFIPIQDLFYL